MLKIKVSYLGKERLVELQKNSTVLELLKKLEINPETVLVRKNKEIIPDTETLKDKDKIQILKIISGG